MAWMLAGSVGASVMVLLAPFASPLPADIAVPRDRGLLPPVSQRAESPTAPSRSLEPVVTTAAPRIAPISTGEQESRIRGTVSLAGGDELATGSFTLRARCGEGLQVFRVNVVDGTFDTGLNQADALEFGDLRSRGKAFRFVSAERTGTAGERRENASHDSPIRLHATAVDSPKIWVRDAQSGSIIPRVHVAFGAAGRTDPGPVADRIIGLDLLVPIDPRWLLKLSRDASSVIVWICAEGYRWERVTVETGSDQEVWVDLGSGVELTVHVEGVDPETPWIVRSRDGLGRSQAQALSQTSEVRLQGLAPGEIDVSIRSVRGDLETARGRRHHRQGHAHWVLHAGPPSEGVAWEGAIDLPVDCNEGPLTLLARPVGAGLRSERSLAQISRGSYGTCLEWSVARAERGRYLMRIPELGWRTTVDVSGEHYATTWEAVGRDVLLR